MSPDTVPIKTRREVWLSVALDVAQGLPEPNMLHIHETDGQRIVSLGMQCHAEVRTWAEHLGLGRCELNGPDGSLWAPHYERDGWSWQIACHLAEPAPEPDPAVAAVVMAALTPDAAELPVGA
jgi:hypothetical protein